MGPTTIPVAYRLHQRKLNLELLQALNSPLRSICQQTLVAIQSATSRWNGTELVISKVVTPYRIKAKLKSMRRNTGFTRSALKLGCLKVLPTTFESLRKTWWAMGQRNGQSRPSSSPRCRSQG